MSTLQQEVSKIISQRLLKGESIALPGFGTLYVERRAARKISADKLLSPRNVVAFQSGEQAPSLVAEIVAVAGCSDEQAADIYQRWSAKTREGSNIKIGGVGVLNHKSFVMESDFASAINPKGVKTIVIRRRSNTWLYALCTVCVLVALGFLGYIMFGGEQKPAVKRVESIAQTEAQPAAEQGVAEPAVAEGQVNTTDNTTAAATTTATTATSMPITVTATSTLDSTRTIETTTSACCTAGPRKHLRTTWDAFFNTATVTINPWTTTIDTIDFEL